MERISFRTSSRRRCSLSVLWEADGDGHLFWECSYLPLVQIRENLEFHDLVQRDKSNWPGCLLWHGWLPALAYPGGRSSSA